MRILCCLMMGLLGLACGAAHEERATTGGVAAGQGGVDHDAALENHADDAGQPSADDPLPIGAEAGSPTPNPLDPDTVSRGPGVAVGACDLAMERDCYPFDPATFERGSCMVGRQTCPGGEFAEWQTCMAAVGPQTESCNGKDDDCDSEVDEGLLNACGNCGPEPAEACNDRDDDCDGKVDEGCSCDAVTTGSGADVVITPADIVLIVDNSASMNDETTAVQTQLQAFADRLAQGGLDARLILLTTRGTGVREICIQPPLASPNCGDNPTRSFFHIDESISSSLGLHDLEKRYSDVSQLFRPGATFHVAIITDDDELWTSGEFLSRYAGWQPTPPALTYHAVVATQDCPAAADIGEHHMDIADRTRGTTHNLCDQRIDLALNGIADGIVRTNIACHWPLPSAPVGGVLDPAQTSVTVTTGPGAATMLPRRVDVSACGSGGGFFVQGSEVSLCAASCTALQNNAQARVDVRIACVIDPR